MDLINSVLGGHTKQQNIFSVTLGLLLVTAFAFIYTESFKWLSNIWIDEKEYSHGFLVPLVSGYFVYLHRRHFTKSSIRQSLPAGLFLIFLAVLILFMGRLCLIIQFEVLSFFLFLPGIIILLFGWDYFLLLLVPLGYLVFMLPVMDYSPGDLHLPLQHLAATGGTKLMQLAGYAVHQEGLFLHLPNMTIKVARQCSGVNLLFSVMAVGIPLVYLYQRSIIRAILVLAGGVLIAVVANSARVALAGMSATHFGIDMLHGPHHIFQAFSVAVAGYIALFLFSYFVNKYNPGKGRLLFEQVAEKFDLLAEKTTQTGGSFFQALIFLFVILLTLTLSFGFFIKPHAASLRLPLSQFPANIRGWTAVEHTNYLGNKFFPNVPVRLERSYVRTDGEIIDCFVGYFPIQNFKNHLFNYHTAELQKHLSPINIASPCIRTLRQINHGFITLYSGPQVEVAMWYWISGESKIDPKSGRFAYARSTLSRHRNDIAIILLSHDIGAKLNQDENTKKLKRFLSLFSCELRNYLP